MPPEPGDRLEDGEFLLRLPVSSLIWKENGMSGPGDSLWANPSLPAPRPQGAWLEGPAHTQPVLRIGKSRFLKYPLRPDCSVGLVERVDVSQESAFLPGVSLFWGFGHARLRGLPDLLLAIPFLSWLTGSRTQEAVLSPMPVFLLVLLPGCSFPPSPDSWLLSCGSCKKYRTPGPAPELQNQNPHFNTSPRQSVLSLHTAKSENRSNALLLIL